MSDTPTPIDHLLTSPSTDQSPLPTLGSGSPLGAVGFPDGSLEWFPELDFPEITPERIHYYLNTMPPTTDIGNAQRLHVHLKGQVIYVPTLDQWFLWTGSHWRQDDNFTLIALAKETVLLMRHQAKQLAALFTAAHISANASRPPTGHPLNQPIINPIIDVTTAQQLRELRAWARRSGIDRRLAAMISLLRSEPAITIPLDQLDQQHYHLPCRNGTINLRTGQLEKANPAHYFTKCLDLDYDPGAPCPRWLSFLNDIMAGDPDHIAFIQRLIGHALTGDATGKYLLFLWGPIGNNGKSTLVEIILRLLGPFALKSPTTMVMHKSYRGNTTNDIARLRGIRFTVTQELDQEMTLSDTIIKDLTGGDTLTARYLRHEFFEFTPTHKLWIYGNQRPQIRGGDPAIWDRIKLLPFDVEIPYNQRDPHLLAKLTSELPGILAWAVAGCLAWQRTGIQVPYRIQTATTDYRHSQSPIDEFIETYCMRGPTVSIAANILYNVYMLWSRATQLEPETITSFGLALERRGFTKTRNGNQRMRKGIALNFDGQRLLDVAHQAARTLFSTQRQ